MSNKIVISEIKANILSLVYFGIFFVLSSLFQYLYFGYITFTINFFIILSPFILIIVHEALHYFGFLIFTDIDRSKLSFLSTKLFPIPAVTTNQVISRRSYMLILLFPTVILIIIYFIITLFTPNILFSVILATSVGVGSGDILLAKRLSEIDNSNLIIPIDSGLGFIVINSSKEAL